MSIKENVQALLWPLAPWVLMIILTWLLTAGSAHKTVSRPDLTRAQQDSIEQHYYRDKEYEPEQMVR